tara:strand:+ start:2238 stop:2489 length:252 start_codon:yes stop_codon:yes gene_type:complete
MFKERTQITPETKVFVLNSYHAQDLGEKCSERHCYENALYYGWIVLDLGGAFEAEYPAFFCRIHKRPRFESGDNWNMFESGDK